MGASFEGRLRSGCSCFREIGEGCDSLCKTTAEAVSGGIHMTSMWPTGGEPMPFVEQAWLERRDLVDRSKLQPSPGGVFEDSWFVMVHSNAPGANAYELAQALQVLQQLVEEKSGMNVTLMLANDPVSRDGR